MSSLQSLNAEVGSPKTQCKDTLVAVQDVQKTSAGLESVIELNVAQATEAASKQTGATNSTPWQSVEGLQQSSGREQHEGNLCGQPQ